MNAPKPHYLVGLILAAVMSTAALAQQGGVSPADETHGRILWKFETGG